MLTNFLATHRTLKGLIPVTSVTHFCPSLSVGKVRFKKKRGELIFMNFGVTEKQKQIKSTLKIVS